MKRGGRLALLVAPLVTIVCVPRAAEATRCPNVMLVLDRSGSMNQDASGGATHPSKWEMLVAAVDRILARYGDAIPFGLEMFTFEDENFPTDEACVAATMIDVSPAPGTASDIAKVVHKAQPGGNTNTGEAIACAAGDPALHDVSRADYIVLITDGDPNCNERDRGDPLSMMPSIALYTIEQIAAAAARTPSIKTFVVGFDGSGGVNPENLNKMALAGGEAQDGCDPKAQGKPCYYSATDEKSLNAAIDGILREVAIGGEFAQAVLCDDSCLSNGCPPGERCAVDEFHPPHCEPDACGAMSCPADTFCRLGQCVKWCAHPCAAGTRCIDGACVADACAGAKCGTGTACDPTSGTCVPDHCVGVLCPPKTKCDIATGKCDADLCFAVTCPPKTACRPGGNCEATEEPAMPMPMPMDKPAQSARASGCSIDRGGDLRAPILIVAIALIGLVRRRRRCA